jgi:hypothetical protein
MGIPVESVTLDKHIITLPKNQRTNLIATISPANADNKLLMWQVSDDIITLDNGIIEAKELGTTKVTVTTDDGRFTDSCIITVTKTTIYDENGRIVIDNSQIITKNTVILDNVKNYKPSLTSLTVPRRGPSYVEEWVNFFNEVLHDITFLMTELNSDADIHNKVSIKEHIHNNLVKVLAGTTLNQNNRDRELLMTIKEGMNLYHGNTSLGTMYIKNTNIFNDETDSSLKAQVDKLNDKLKELES